MAKKVKVKSKIKTIDKDLGVLDILKQLRKLEEKPFVKVGFPSGGKSDSLKKFSIHNGEEIDIDETVTVLDTAIWNEFGTETIPERSFVRSAFDQNRSKYEKKTKELMGQIYASKISVERALDILGLMLETDIKKMIKEGSFTPNSVKTIARKGSDKPLIDTGQMINAVRFKRIMNGRKK